VAVFLLQQVAGDAIATWFALWPLGSPLFEPWQLISYAFLHGNLAHIFFNMFGLFMFGSALERYWGSRRLLTFYLVCVLSAALTHLVVQSLSAMQEPVVGASGGLFGLMLAFAWYFPRQRMILLIAPIPLPAWLFVTLYGVLELFFGVTGRQQDVAHFAHLGGMLGGALCILYWRGQRSAQR
jgi:membrane associated rhomboid family serine protease